MLLNIQLTAMYRQIKRKRGKAKKITKDRCLMYCTGVKHCPPRSRWAVQPEGGEGGE